MRSTELFRTCANEHVAAAALACIGGTLERRVAAAARRAGVTTGAFVASLVADYDRKASPKRRQSLEHGMFRNPMPILAGLRHVVHVALEGAWDAGGNAARNVASNVSWGAARDASRGEVVRQGEIHWSGRSRALAEKGPVLKCLHC
jgi:hypothetical protein